MTDYEPPRDIWEVNATLRFDEPLNGDQDPCWVDTHAARGDASLDRLTRALGVDMATGQLRKAPERGYYLFCGHRGSGKSTELRHIRNQLDKPDIYHVVLADAALELDVHNLRYQDILLHLAGNSRNVLTKEEFTSNQCICGASMSGLRSAWKSRKQHMISRLRQRPCRREANHSSLGQSVRTHQHDIENQCDTQGRAQTHIAELFLGLRRRLHGLNRRCAAQTWPTYPLCGRRYRPSSRKRCGRVLQDRYLPATADTRSFHILCARSFNLSEQCARQQLQWSLPLAYDPSRGKGRLAE